MKGNICIGTSRLAEACPYCQAKDFVKRGVRKNQYQIVQLYLCKNPACGRTFTAQDVKGRKFPLNLVIECLNYYNLGFNFQQTCAIVKQKFKVAPDPQTLSGWMEQYKNLCRFERMRPWAIKMYKPQDMVEVVTMAHRQIFRFRYHRAKTRLLLEEFGNRYFVPLKDYLDNVSSETPHQYFQQGERMSDIRSKFDKAQMIVKAKNNYANRLSAFVLQAVKLNKDRHDALQRFMLANDSCTVATEVPVYIRKEDIEHMERVLNFQIIGEEGIRVKGGKSDGVKKGNVGTGTPHLLTGHIDFVQIRNGSIHLLDYKPNAAKERPIEQLTWYALAMSRLTGLRLFDFKCGWFDEKNYYQFFPLHVVKKLKNKKTKKINFKDGTWVEVPRKNLEKVVIV
ncbi:MAG: hypothetical protein COT34_00295 [Candidatus Nealsonbacteria bacterium CG08_land_8_20_14_0_20_43_11]|uniref:PD-(D/E)XK endonuclease-like domain-containing protein n=1 Tax=Candidatus Nealsonbacteria bacterium CG08_land_8_20_14_0_20_43_11 TaxID=1974706 RepID=A0A2M6T186_9BACT|nr:MAG: hypothetical protein COT34_00295 [Candidatus Nealsonbacteria bacterium CG08_land_8_20_14_0_20_43_11]